MILIVSWILLAQYVSASANASDAEMGRPEMSAMSPYYQRLPDCGSGYERITKKTAKKAMVCPMFKDEKGFLSEWVAYYQIHGFDHVRLYDDGSTDNGVEELRPWIRSGFVSIARDPVKLFADMKPKKDRFDIAMQKKEIREIDCRRYAVARGYDFEISVDIDEYIVPNHGNITAVDALAEWAENDSAMVFHLHKYNFQSSPHIVEPIDLLTIEAYQLRVQVPLRMNYYTTVATKIAINFRSPLVSENTTTFLSDCCHFHGCKKQSAFKDNTFCSDNERELVSIYGQKDKHWPSTVSLYHYSRSAEKFGLKTRTWTTAGGEQLTDSHVVTYDMAKFFSRSVGWFRDRSALRYSCQVREKLREMTGQARYLRPGDSWVRNAEFGRPVMDAEKRLVGRGNNNDNGNTMTMTNEMKARKEVNPYSYSGIYVTDAFAL